MMDFNHVHLSQAAEQSHTKSKDALVNFFEKNYDSFFTDISIIYTWKVALERSWWLAIMRAKLIYVTHQFHVYWSKVRESSNHLTYRSICVTELGRHWFKQQHVACSALSHYLNNVDLLSITPTVKFLFFFSKSIWILRLQHGGHFDQVSKCCLEQTVRRIK